MSDPTPGPGQTDPAERTAPAPPTPERSEADNRGAAGPGGSAGTDADGAEGPELVVLPDSAAVALAAARRIADALSDAVEDHGRADFSTTGGSAPLGIYPLLAAPPFRELVPWGEVHLWWGDERFVPRDHPQSNVRPADDLLMRWPARSGESGVGASGSDIRQGIEPGVFIPNEHVHPFPCTEAIAEGRGADWVAARYLDELRGALRIEHGWPAFDLVLLGVGPDGHIFSVFPGSAALGSRQWAIAVPAPTHVEPHLPRVTLNPAILTAARAIVVVATGEGKADVLGRIFGSDRDPRQLPAQLALRQNATWYLDRAAATRISR